MIEILYERIVGLLGTSKEAFAGFSSDIGEEPAIDALDGTLWIYTFRQTGIHFYYNHVAGIVEAANLLIATASVRANEDPAYSGDLPYGITRTDTAEQVEQKLPGATMAVKDYRFDTDLRPLVFTCHFSAPDLQAPGVGERILSMVSIELDQRDGSIAS